MSARLAQLDGLSRIRALTRAESLELERELCHADRARLPTGLTRALARLGVKRDMARFRRSADHKMLGTAGNGGLVATRRAFGQKPRSSAAGLGCGGAADGQSNDQRRVEGLSTAGDGGLPGAAKALE